MAMAHTRRRWTLAEVHSLPEDGNRYELVHGDLFATPAPTPDHETVLVRLTRLLDPYVIANGLGMVYHPRSVVRIRDVVQVEPDLMVRQEIPSGVQWEDAPTPILVIEVASDSTRRRDQVLKRGVYADAGIPDYWIVDGDTRTIRVIRTGQHDLVVHDSFTWHPTGAGTALTVGVDDVFRTPPSDD